MIKLNEMTEQKVSERMLETFHDSLRRCQAHPRFMPLFYSRFIDENKEVAEKFVGSDMKAQHLMLEASLQMVMLASSGKDAAQLFLKRVAQTHAKSERDIPPSLYACWLDSLLSTVEDIDPEHTADVAVAWRTVMRFGIEFLTARYEAD